MEKRGEVMWIFYSLQLHYLTLFLSQIVASITVHILCFISLTFYSSPRSYQECRYIFSTPLEECFSVLAITDCKLVLVIYESL